jgi:hypothetical protein
MKVQMNSNLRLATMLTLGKRTDLEFALFLGSTTKFSIKDVMQGSTAILCFGNNLMQGDQIVTNRLDFLLSSQFNTDLQDLLVDMKSLAALLNDISAGHQRKLDNYVFHDTIILWGYRLIYISPVGDLHFTNRLENALYMGLAAFLITFTRRLDHSIPDMPLLSELARSAAQEHFDDAKETQELLLWLLFVGECSIFKETDDAWLVPSVMQKMQALDLHTWEDVQQTLAKWPWVSVLHDKTGEALCRRSRPTLGRLAWVT